MTYDIPDKMDIDIDQKDLEEGIEKILDSMQGIRVEYKTDQEDLKEYANLTYRLASYMKAMEQEDSEIGDKIAEVSNAMKNAKELQNYDPSQDGFWREQSPEFVNTLDKIMVATARDSIDILDKKHHMAQAIKYLAGDSEMKIAPAYHGVDTPKVGFEKEGWFGGKKFVELPVRKIDATTLYFEQNTINYIKIGGTAWQHRFQYIRKQAGEQGFTRLSFPKSIYKKFLKFEDYFNNNGISLEAGQFDGEGFNEPVVILRSSEEIAKKSGNIMNPLKNICNIIPETSYLNKFIFEMLGEPHIVERIVKDAKATLFKGKEPENEIKAYIAYSQNQGSILDFIKENITEDAEHGQFIGKYNKLGNNWAKEQIMAITKDDNIYVVSSVYKISDDSPSLIEEVRKETTVEEKLRNIAEKNTFTHIIKMKDGKLIEDLEAINWKA